MCIRDSANSQGLRGLRTGGLRIGACEMAISRPRTRSRPAFVGRFVPSVQRDAERTPRELR
eukprot:13038020-Alexandrium_andersonii.AAC.1